MQLVGQLLSCLLGENVDVGGVGVLMRLQAHLDHLLVLDVLVPQFGFDMAEDRPTNFAVDFHC